ncbi:MAG: SRPBCC family protein [Actinomycetota bacterium]|nr:SRPBCC family protein [Actinomycetota bacterium]
MPRITRTTFVAAPASSVWELVGDFAQWHPRLRTAPDGPEASPELVVTVVERNQETMTLSYSMPEPPYPITDHKATILVEPSDTKTSHVTWSADFDADPAILQELEDQVGNDIFEQALDRLATTAQDTYGAEQVAKGS